ncbi:MAG: methylmalonyl-CoA mutase family protein, partial [Betaproteobacteria bacterium]
GVNAFKVDEDPDDYHSLDYPERERINAHIERLRAFKATRSNAAVAGALDALAQSAQSMQPARDNIFAAVVEAADAGATHGEICACLRRELGFGQPLTIV